MATERKNKQVSTTVSPERFAALEEYRWANRINKTGDVLTLAVDEFIANHNIVVPDPDPTDEPAPAKGK